MKIGQILRKIVMLKPILKILGVKDKTVVSKGLDVVEVIEKTINEEKNGTKEIK